MFGPGYTSCYSIVVGIAGGVIAIVYSVLLGKLSANYRGEADMSPRYDYRVSSASLCRSHMFQLKEAVWRPVCYGV